VPAAVGDALRPCQGAADDAALIAVVPVTRRRSRRLGVTWVSAEFYLVVRNERS
jgi:hypothetical protein